MKSLSRVQLFATPWTAAHQAPLSMGFSRQEYWSGWLLPSPITKTRHSQINKNKYLKKRNALIPVIVIIKVYTKVIGSV